MNIAYAWISMFFVEAAFFARTVHVMCKSLVLSLEVLFFVWKRIESDRKPWLDSFFLVDAHLTLWMFTRRSTFDCMSTGHGRSQLLYSALKTH